MAQSNLKVKDLNIESIIRKYLSEAKSRLDTDFLGSREAIKEISDEKVREFLVYTDLSFGEKDRELLKTLYASSMCQAFCYGYGLAKAEEASNRKILL